MSKVQLVNLKKEYDKDVVAVSDFNLEIEDREFIVFVGPSGCGKSTTLRMIAGLEEITDGELYIENKIVNDIPPKDRDIAMVFQNYALYPHMNVYDNMAFGLKLRKFKKDVIKEKVHHAAGILGLEDYLDRKPKALSGGQRQRVALGRAIVRDANVFLMDEPLSNLDAKLRVQMRAEIQKLHRRLNTTTIYVTHDQTEAMTMASRLVVMKDGYIQQVGTPKEIYEFPENIFVGDFIGSPSMNFFEGKLAGDYFEIDGVKIKVPESKMQLLKEHFYLNKTLILGIRPEDIHYKPQEPEKFTEATIDAAISVAELTGSEIILYSKIGSQEFVGKVDAKHDIQALDKIKLSIDLTKASFFDKETEKRIR